MNINNAILHVFDFVSCVNVFAQAPMDLGNKAAKRYVTSQAKRALGNLDSKRGTFAENSLFAEELRAYFRGERDFVGLSQQIGEFIVGELSRMEKTPSTDLLVVDFEGDADQTVREMTDEEAEAAYKARGPRYFAIILLESRQAYMHEVGSNDFGDTATTIARHHAILPNPSQKVASFALISADDMAVWFVDKEREIAGEKRWIIPDGLLQCSMEASSREVLEAVTTVVEEVAEEFGANTAVALSRAKAYVAVERRGVRRGGRPRAGPRGVRRPAPRRRALRSPPWKRAPCPSASWWRRPWPSGSPRATRFAPTRASSSPSRPNTARTPISSSSSAPPTAASRSRSKTSARLRTARTSIGKTEGRAPARGLEWGTIQRTPLAGPRGRPISKGTL